MKFNFKLLLFLVLFCLLSIGFAYWSVHQPLFHDQYSSIIEDKNGDLLDARIAADGQWRFPSNKKDLFISPKYWAAVMTFEDRRFYTHPGVDFLAVGRAFISNLKAGHTVSGGSTLTMQVVSLYRKHKSTNFFDKFSEMLFALWVDAFHSKQDIFRLYATHAPFGGNTVGYEAALWRYFGKHNKELTWAEAALLAVLPNDPALIHLGRNRNLLKKKRDRLLVTLAGKNLFPAEDLPLYQAEALPGEPKAMPHDAPHLLTSMQKLLRNQSNTYVTTTIDGDLQRSLSELLQRKGIDLKANQLHNAAILVAKVQTGEVLAYVGNIPHTGSQNSEQVDIIQAERSSGSLLKPFLSMLAIQDGMVNIRSLLPDIPVNINGFRPDNFNYEFEGSVSLREALQQSLNVPFVLLLREYNIARFLKQLRQLGLGTLRNTADYYGLSLIIGGGEVTLWDICGAFASSGRILQHYNTGQSRYYASDIHPLSILPRPITQSKESVTPTLLNSGAIWSTFEALSNHTRPQNYSRWQEWGKNGDIAWKTGTSIGFRDAWCIGLNRDYIVGVWIGNADGEGRPGVIGLETAAPLMFDVFQTLPQGRWFDTPYDALARHRLCVQSGYQPNEACKTDTFWTVKNLDNLPICTYDRLINLDAEKKYRVNANCYDPYAMRQEAYFVLPPSQQYYYEQKHPAYKHMPPFLPDCNTESADNPISLLYPNNISKIFIPRAASGDLNPVILKAAHRNPGAIIYWHLDNQFIGQTIGKHTLPQVLAPGKHILTCVDQEGNKTSAAFEVKYSEAKSFVKQ